MSKKTKNVNIKITSTTTDLLDAVENEDNSEHIEYVTTGSITENNGQMELEYKELKELGMDNSTTTLLFNKDNPQLINMVRSGGCTAGLIFNSEIRRMPCAYNVQGMGIQFCIDTKKVVNNLTLEGGSIDLDYILEFNGCKTERNQFRIEVNQ